MPSFIACGGREQTFDKFKIAQSRNKETILLLVDSEEPVAVPNWSNYTSEAWDHLAARDGWQRPAAAADDQAQLMATSMETWITTDRSALRRFFPHINENALLPKNNLEGRQKNGVFSSLVNATAGLVNATAGAGSQKQYKKGDKSFRLLATLDPETLRSNLPHFSRFVEALNRHLPEPRR
jgi:hypothetical protein